MPVRLRDFGSYTVGGDWTRVTTGAPREVQFTRQARFTYDPRGHFRVGQTYVQYFVPDAAGDGPPFVLIHGGGMTGSTWETTPDGRPGWLHRLLERGHAVHVIDMVERGRSGFAAGIWDEAPILRSAEEAWTLFRFGAAADFAARRPYRGQQFQVDRFDTFCDRFVPRWFGNTALQVAGVAAVLDRLGDCHVICHSQGAEIAFDAAEARPGAVRSLLAVEPSALPGTPPPFPFVVMAGDFLGTEPHWTARAEAWRAAAGSYIDTAREVAPGGSHMLMMDRHSDACLDAGLAALGLG